MPLQPAITRKPVYGKAAVSSSQPLASAAGLQALAQGGNAADAAIAMAAMLAVTEPCSNGLGGDLVALHHASDATTAVLGNGASPAALTSALYGVPPIPPASPHTVTVPGVVAAWLDVKSRFGSRNVTLAQLLDPAIRAAETGFPVAPTTAYYWQLAEPSLRDAVNADVYLVNDPGTGLRAPRAGEIFRNPHLASVLRDVVQRGRSAFYEGKVAAAIVSTLQSLGGVMSLQDLARHQTRFASPISTTYRDHVVYEVGAPTHGAVALMGLNILETFPLSSEKADMCHVMIEALRLSFADAANYIADPSSSKDRTAELSSKEHCTKLAERIKLDTKCAVDGCGSLPAGGTVQFCVIDSEGTAMSVVQSNYQGFGTGHVPSGCGFTLQNRGLNFVADQKHVNCVGGGKRSYHTIMPGLMTGRETVVAFGVMGSFMQPQGHLQVVHGLVDRGLNSQQALDRPRFRVTGAFSGVESGMGVDAVLVERDVPESLREELRRRGHIVKEGRLADFGKGHICLRRNGVVEAGADNRADGEALVFV